MNPVCPFFDQRPSWISANRAKLGFLAVRTTNCYRRAPRLDKSDLNSTDCGDDLE
jgi:hypothetical protein